jgi:NitT/TauT family transport system permease protein
MSETSPSVSGTPSAGHGVQTPEAPADAQSSGLRPGRRSTVRLRQRRRTYLVHVLQVLLLVAVIVLWQVLSDAKILDPFFYSKPSAIISQIRTWNDQGLLWPSFGATLEETALSFALGSVGGIILGFVLARADLLGRVLRPYLSIFNAMPRIVFGPIFIIILGLGIASKVALGISIVMIPVFFNTFEGIRQVDPVYLANARMLGASRLGITRRVLAPSAMVWILSSLELSVGFAISGAVIGEYLGSNEGIGYLVSNSQGTFNTAGVYAGIILLGVIVVVILPLVGLLSRWLLRWQRS